MLRLEQMQALLKTEPEEADDEIVDIVTAIPPCQKLKVKEEEQEADVEPKFFLGPCLSAQFVSDAAQQVGNHWGFGSGKKTCCLNFKCKKLHHYVHSNAMTPVCLSDRGNLPASRGGEECVRSSSRRNDSEGRCLYRQHTSRPLTVAYIILTYP